MLLRLFERFGRTAFERLNGGYSLIVWDKIDRVGTVNTCKFGQRTLYTVRTVNSYTFATDLGALRRLSAHTFELDSDTLWMSFLQGGIPGTGTPLRGVSKVLPGSTIRVDGDKITEFLAPNLAGLETIANPRRAKDFYLDTVDHLMRTAVGRLGRVTDSHALMIGGGVDSSLIGAYAKDEIDGVVAITQQMPGDLDESGAASRIVEALGLEHLIVPYRPTEGDLLDEVSAFVRITGEPAYWNQLGPPLLQLLGLLPEQPSGFLTGAEADHLFVFTSGKRPSVRQVIRDGLFWPVAHYTVRRLVNRVTRHTYIVGTDFDLLDRTLMRRQLAVDLPDATPDGSGFNPSYPHLAEGPNAQRHFINNAWQNVRIISQLAERVGSEALFPYMDDDVVAAMLSLPDELKINKVLLRILLSARVPGLRVPTKKRGYWAHTIRWYYEAKALAEALDLMSQRRTLERGVYDRSALTSLVDSYRRGTASSEAHPVFWQLLLFEAYCREFVDDG